MAKQNSIEYTDAYTQLCGFAIYLDLQRIGSPLSDRQALKLVNSGLSLTSLGYVTSADLAGLLEVTEEDTKSVSAWALKEDIRVITLDILMERLARQKDYFIFLLAAGAAAFAILAFR